MSQITGFVVLDEGQWIQRLSPRTTDQRYGTSPGVFQRIFRKNLKNDYS
jgi:hypothetical protein